MIARANPASRRLADLAGQDANGNWHVVEAKARQLNPSAQSWQDWKQQAQTIATNPAAHTRSACVTLVQNIYSVELRDPPPSRPTARITIDRAGFLQLYYSPVRDFLTRNPIKRMRGKRSLLVRFAAFDAQRQDCIYLGAERSVAEGGDAIGTALEGPDFYIGSDGIAIITSPTLTIR